MEAAWRPAGLEHLRLVGSGPPMLHPKAFGVPSLLPQPYPDGGDALGMRDGGLRGGSAPAGVRPCSECADVRQQHPEVLVPLFPLPPPPTRLNPTMQTLNARHRESSLNST